MSGDNERIERYDHPAGGWGALATSTRHIIEQRDLPRSVKALLRVNQPDGFDCPGCAWPDPKDAGAFEFCENGVKAVAWEATGKRVTPDFFAKHTVTELLEQSDHWLEDQGRLTHPMRYNAQTDHYEPIRWEAAFKIIGDTLRGFDDPNQAVFYTSGRTSNEAAFLYQLFARMYGTNNMPDCSNMCHESSGYALAQSIGIGKGTVTLDDFDKADAVFIIGQNPGTNHPRMLTTLQQCSRRGAKIVAVNPLRERGLESFIHPQHPTEMLTGKAVPIASLYLQPHIGGDMAMLAGMIKLVIDAGAVDKDFIDRHTTGYDELAAHVAEINWDTIERESGLSRDELQQLADVYIESDATIICWAMGLTQHKHAVPTLQMLTNLLLLRGNIGKPGAGACPVRGHSNVQGDRTMGIVHYIKPAFAEKLRETFGFDPPTEHGHDTVGALEAMAKGEAKAFIAMGGNFIRATPDTAYTERALRNCDLTVQVSTKLNRSHLVVGKDALILPCLARTELDVQLTGAQQVTVEDSMSMVHASSGKNPPASPYLLSEPAIVAGVAKATLEPNPRVPWDDFIADYRLIRDRIADCIPHLFADFNEKIKQPGGFHLRNSARERDWNTKSGKANFITHPLPRLAPADGLLRMMTVRSHDQYNTTIYDNNDRYRGVHGTRMVVFMNGKDIIDRGLRDGDVVDIISEWNDGESRRAEGFRVVEYDIPAGSCATYFPETNVLVAYHQYADGSRCPVSKFVPVRVEKRGG